jgi:hypothetical protein
MTQTPTIRAYIDGANLDKGVKALGWKINHWRFRSWIRQKFGVTDACLFIGMMPKHASLYTALQNAGFRLVFKEVLYSKDGAAKGNCDADLVLQGVKDFYEEGIKSVILVASDGDYAPLVKFWKEKGVKCTILSPAPMENCSILLKRTGVPIVCLCDVKNKISLNEKAPGTDVSVQGSSS